jgi:RHS repeat-associated protein
VVATYTYDALGRRIGIKDSGTQTWTVFNGTGADADPYADFNSSGSVTERYLFGPGAISNVILARTNASGSINWYMTNQLGSVTDLMDTSGNDLDQITYDPYGNIVSQTGSSYADRFLFAGMQYDTATGLYYDHARYYDASIGRFMSQDPMGFAAHDANLYRYVENCPTDRTDMSGLIDWTGTPFAGHLKVAPWFDPGKTGIEYIPESGGPPKPLQSGQVVDADALIIPGVGLIKIAGGGTIELWGHDPNNTADPVGFHASDGLAGPNYFFPVGKPNPFGANVPALPGNPDPINEGTRRGPISWKPISTDDPISSRLPK